jgi:hypothetical protein
MFPKFARVKRPHPVESASDVFEVKPTFMAPSKSNKKTIKRSRTEVSLRKGEKFAPASKTSRFGRVPAKVRESTTQCVGSVNRPSGREPRSHEDPIPIDKVRVLTGPIPVLWRGDHKHRQIGMDDRIDTVPELDCPISNCDKTFVPQQSLLKIVMEGNGVEHP